MSHTSMASRRGPLQACGASTLAIALSLYKKAVELNGPIGSVTSRLGKLGSKLVSRPLVYMVLYPWLAILFIVDDLILSTEKILETLFPPLRHVFDKIDSLVGKVENLPKDFENAMRKFPEVLYKIPFLYWVVMFICHYMAWLEFLTSVLVIWGMESVKEKEIKVDTNCNNEQSSQNEVSSSMQDVHTRDNNAHTIGDTDGYKQDSSLPVSAPTAALEDLEQEVKENMKTEDKLQGVGEDNASEAKVKQDDRRETRETKNEIETVTKDDDHPLLEFFDFGWETPKTNVSRRRASYT